MAGPFDPGPVYTYPTWAQGLQQGTQGLANALYQRKLLDLERQKFGLQQAEAGYQPAHQEQVYQPGKLAAPSMVSVGNVPSPTPGVSQMGAGPTSPDAMARTAGQYKTTNVPGYYDITKSLPYITSLARVLEMQTRGEEAARIAAQSREAVAAQNNATKTNMFGQLNGYIGADGQFHPGLRLLGNEQQSDYEFGPNGTRTQSALTVQAPRIAEQAAASANANATRQGNLTERQRHDLATEGTAQQGLALRQQTANQRTGQLGNLTPAEARAWQSAYGNAAYMGMSPDSAEARANTAVAALRRTTGPVQRPGAASAPAIAPHAVRSGAEASALTPGGTSGAGAPVIPLGNRNVGNSSTRTRATSQHLPKSPSDATAGGPSSTQKLSSAQIEQFYQQAIAAGADPAKAKARRDSLLAGTP